MMKRHPDYLFETSWEVCNKVGGIYTVLSTKAFTVMQQLQQQYICIGPDVLKDDDGDFIEDASLFKSWQQVLSAEGLKVRIGRWNIPGAPIVFLVDFTSFFEKKNEILTEFWLNYQLDSISGQWDYIEPVLFGYAAARVIESFYDFHCTASDQIVAHFHEWMTGSGILHIEKNVPQIATVFTTHATVLGRCIAGNSLPLYQNIEQYHPEEYANKFGVMAKFSLEKLSAKYADAFTTVSDITSKECATFLQKEVDVVTINGFENHFVPQGDEYGVKRAQARQKLLAVAGAITQQKIEEDALLVINSGRYEFKNKGIDLFIEALAKLKKENLNKEVVAFITVPAGTAGARYELISKIEAYQNGEIPNAENAVLSDFSTHFLHDSAHDPIINKAKELKIDNATGTKVKLVFVPTYLDGCDEIFRLRYYDLLIGFDLSVFPSYYEPWGYTPLESVAFGIPTLTTTLAGFGMWTQKNFGSQKSSWVITRLDDNDSEVSDEIAAAITFYSNMNEEDRREQSALAVQISQHALWENLFQYYQKTYQIALEKSAQRSDRYCRKISKIGVQVNTLKSSEPKWVNVMVTSELPRELKPLEKLAHNLWWSWNYEARELFEEIAGLEMWEEYQENPTHILQILSLDTLEQFSKNETFLTKLHHVYRRFEDYMSAPKERKEGKVAYFSMEFGVSNELKIFSGGLGMLAGDYLKEASDCNVNMIGVGLLYRNGYFTQQISAIGDQVHLYPPQSFSKLPIHPVRDENGNFKTIAINLPGRVMLARYWRVDVGRIPLYLLDADIEKNHPKDRMVTHTLYGGDIENRLKQEILLGVGGVRMIEALGEKPVLFHLNEGHAAFLTLERLNQEMQKLHCPFSVAAEIVKSSSLYTTHTPVPAGHDSFSEDLMRTYFSAYPAKFNMSWEQFMALGRKHIDSVHDKFSMSILSLKLSQEVNGVSKIHGRVSQEMFAHLYKGHFANELHVGYVTNGVHYPTWTHKKWQQLHLETFGNDFIADQSNQEIWKKIETVPNKKLWGLKNELRAELLGKVRELLAQQMQKRNESPELIVKTIKAICDNTLTIGFARRFATYKRAHLLFMNEDKLAQIVNHPERPVQFLFAGKAHPADKAGQDLIKRIIEISRQERFIGKIIFLENYDMILAKYLISGCDVWLNNPTRPLEASGTSGEKAIMNGVLNCSVLDGWWAEGFVPGAGWALEEKPTYDDYEMQDQLDAATLYNIVEDQMVKIFYSRGANDVADEWAEMMKRNFAEISPRFTMKRQLDDYYTQFYQKLEKRHLAITKDDNFGIYELIKWKEKVLTCWDSVCCDYINIYNDSDNSYKLSDKIEIIVDLRLGILLPEEVKIEICFQQENSDVDYLFKKFPLTFVKKLGEVSRFSCCIMPIKPGSWKTGIRIFPSNKMLPHDFDFHLVRWLS